MTSFTKKNESVLVDGLIFIFLFVAQQIVAFTSVPFNLVTPYWILMILIFFIVGLSLPNSRYRKSDAFRFSMVCALFAMLTIANGTSIGEVIVKILYMLFAYWGFVFISEKKISLWVFDILLLILYVVFYRYYYQYDILTRIAMDEDVFGHASSNTIAMTLNIVTYFYLLISRSYKADNRKRLIIFSSINLILIILQGSRAGMLVSLLILLLTVFSAYNTQSKWKKWLLYIVVISAISYFVVQYLSIVEEFLSTNKIGADSYENDVRSEALRAFFAQMGIKEFFIGYPVEHYFVGEIYRTFNAFFDFWKVYGIIPFAYLVFLFVRRLVNHKDYEIPAVFILPFLAYSFFESLWGGSFWDVLLFMILFYSKKNEKNYQQNFKLA